MDATNQRGFYVAPGEGPKLWVLSELMTFIVGAKETDGRYALTDSLVPPGGEAPPHRHEREDEAFWVLAGELEIVVGNDRYVAHAGSFVHLPRGITHAYRNVGTGTARFLTLMVPAGLEAFFQEVGTSAADPLSPPTVEELDLTKVTEIAATYGVFIEES